MQRRWLLTDDVSALLQVQAASDRFLAELGRHNYVTLTSYLQLLSSFKSMLEAKRTANTTARKRYTVGLEKLASSASQVAGMQAELVAMQPQLVATVAEVEELMARIAQEKKVGCGNNSSRQRQLLVLLLACL